MATTVVFNNDVCSNFTDMSSRTLLSDHVYGTSRPLSSVTSTAHKHNTVYNKILSIPSLHLFLTHSKNP